MIRRDGDIVEYERACFRRVGAGHVVSTLELYAGGSTFHRQSHYILGGFTGLREHQQQISRAGVGHPGLLAVDDVVPILHPGAATDRRGVGPGSRLGKQERTYGIAGKHTGQIAVPEGFILRHGQHHGGMVVYLKSKGDAVIHASQFLQLAAYRHRRSTQSAQRLGDIQLRKLRDHLTQQRGLPALLFGVLHDRRHALFRKRAGFPDVLFIYRGQGRSIQFHVVTS